MTVVKTLLESKGSDIWSVSPDASVYDAIRLMAEKEVGALLVLRDGALVGIVSERDYARKVVLKGRSSKSTPVSEVMTARVAYARPDQSVDECMAMMTEKRVRHLPVMDGDRLLGVVSIGDLVKSIIAEQQDTIRQLEQYISG
ncbi:MAG: CBS domain-containing protein [Gammaproteobacteria bacterium]|nr:CBS domain-containing protein [Gammaproteobacteria bacterium]